MNVTVPDVLGALFNPADTVCFRVFDDKKGGMFRLEAFLRVREV